MFFKNKIFDLYVTFQGFFGKIRRFFVADIRIQSGDGAYAFVDEFFAAFAVDSYAFDTVFYERIHGAVERVKRFEKFIKNYGFESV